MAPRLCHAITFHILQGVALSSLSSWKMLENYFPKELTVIRVKRSLFQDCMPINESSFPKETSSETHSGILGNADEFQGGPEGAEIL